MPRNFTCDFTGVQCSDPRCKKGSCIIESEEKERARLELLEREALVREKAETLALNAARELVRMAIKQRNLDKDEWPASRISQAAKALLDSQGEDGKILQTARRQIEAELNLLRS